MNDDKWIYIKDGTIEETVRWIQTFIPDMALVYAGDPTTVYRVSGDEKSESVSFCVGIGVEMNYLEVTFTNVERWALRDDLAKEAFLALNREIIWAPSRPHPQGEFSVINAKGEYTVDLD